MERSGIEFDCRTNQQRTPLHIAASRGHTLICKVFIERQVPKTQQPKQNTPTDIGRLRSESNDLEEEKKEKGDSQVDSEDANKGVEEMLEPAVDKNCTDVDGNTPLHLAAEQGHQDCLKYLMLGAQCDFTLKNKFGYVAYDIAYNTEVRNMMKELISRLNTADIETNQYGRRAFNNKLQHNDRVTKLKSLMHKFNEVDKHLKDKNQ